MLRLASTTAKLLALAARSEGSTSTVTLMWESKLSRVEANTTPCGWNRTIMTILLLNQAGADYSFHTIYKDVYQVLPTCARVGHVISPMAGRREESHLTRGEARKPPTWHSMSVRTGWWWNWWWLDKCLRKSIMKKHKLSPPPQMPLWLLRGLQMSVINHIWKLNKLSETDLSWPIRH